MDDLRAAKLAIGRKRLENHQRKKKHVAATTDDEDHTFHGAQNIACNSSNHSVNGESEAIFETSDLSKDNDSSIDHYIVLDSSVSDSNVHIEGHTNKDTENISTYQKSIEILVNDKSTLSTKIKYLENEILDSKGKNEDLIFKLNTLNKYITHLEHDVDTLKSCNEKLQTNVNEYLNEKNERQLIEKNINQRCKDLEEKLEESTSTLRALLTEKETLKLEVNHLRSEYEISQLNIRQVSQSHNLDVREQLQLIMNEKNTYQKLYEEIQNKFKESEEDKQQTNQQYQQYVQQLNNQLESLTEKHQNLILDFANVKDHEQSLIDQMVNLEKQLQSMPNHTEKVKIGTSNDLLAEIEGFKKHNIHLNASLHEKEEQNNALKLLLAEREFKIEDLNETLMRLQAEKIDLDKLNAANESDRVAAQLATCQNSKLKDEMTNLQNAYNNMSTAKLELSQLLETERNLNKDLIRKLGDDEHNVKDLQIKLKAKDDEMIRLQSNCRKLETEILQLTQINDNLRHYEAISQNVNLLQNELDIVHQKFTLVVEENKKLKLAQARLVESDGITMYDTDNEVRNGSLNDKNINDIESNFLPTDEAMKKLQERFTVTVKELAEITDEKQKLEHIVLQLQSETETICEYIALYHKQRAMLKQREVEQNSQVTLIAQESSKMKGQLDELNSLMAKMIRNSESKSVRTTHSQKDQDTLKDIISLLSEITNNRLIGTMYQNEFGPCPCCSGNIINV